MTVRLLGTGAADGIPGLYSGCRVAQYAREHGGKDVRSRCGALVDLGIKIDLPPETRHQLWRDGLDARDWCALLFTHSDDDHFALAELQYALYPFNDMDHLGFTVYGNEEVCRRLRERYPNWPMEIVQTRSFEPFTHSDYRITPVMAKHKTDEDAHNLLIERNGQTLLYATDTGIWDEPTWEFLRAATIDLLVIECTEGLTGTDYDGHINAAECIEMVERLRSQGSLQSHAVVVTTHHSQQGDATHEELEAVLNPAGIRVGYDGLVVQI